jgi:hypothetical protein
MAMTVKEMGAGDSAIASPFRPSGLAGVLNRLVFRCTDMTQHIELNLSHEIEVGGVRQSRNRLSRQHGQEFVLSLYR